MNKALIVSILVFIILFSFKSDAFAKTSLVLENGTLTKISTPDVLGVSSDGENSVETASESSIVDSIDELLSLIPTQDKLTVSFIGNKAREFGKEEIDKLVVVEDEEGTEIKSSDGLLVIKSGVSEAQTQLPIVVTQEDGKIYIARNNNKTLLNLLPSDAQKAIDDVKKTTDGVPIRFELKENGAEIVYEYIKEEDQKVLGLVPVKTTITTVVSAQSGEVNTTTSSWFSDLLKKLFA